MIKDTSCYRLGIPLSVSSIVLLLAGLSSLCAAQESSHSLTSSEVRVWANSKSGIYHCPGDSTYGNTAKGQFMTEAEALRTGFRPARGRYCQSATAPEQQPAVTRCGFERWPVKVLTDKDASTVDFKPKSATIAELAELPPPHSYPQMNRLAPVEVTVFRVPAVVRRVHFESDSDIHVVLSDPGVPSDTIIAEIPAPDCAVGSGHETDFATARKVALRLKPGTHVMVVGVGFFDKTHGQASSARNGIELHPVLLISPAESEK